jgi:hypothetical protein
MLFVNHNGQASSCGLHCSWKTPFPPNVLLGVPGPVCLVAFFGLSRVICFGAHKSGYSGSLVPLVTMKAARCISQAEMGCD